MAKWRSSRNLARQAAKGTAINVERERENSPTPPPPTVPTIYHSVPRDGKGYLQRIYTAADQIYRRGRPKPRTPYLVNGIIIQARCARVLMHLSDEGRAAYLAVIARIIPSLGGRAQVIAGHMRTMGRKSITMRRLSAFVDRFGFLLLSICAHSKSFRFIVLHAHLGNRNRALWRELCNLIESHAYSIELYARTRGLGLQTSLIEGGDEWDQIICRSLHDVLAEHSTFTEDQVLGISDTEYLKRHELPDNIGHYHEWVVSSEPKTAYNPEMTYRTGRGRNSRLVTERQINIDSSIILDKPVWVNRRHWPIDDPRYRSLASDPCEVCPANINDGKLVLKYCDHTLADLCRRNGSKIAKVSSRVELLHYAGKGVGVRALKAFRKNEIMAEYVGEIYPEKVVRKDTTENVDLYPSDSGLCYRFQQSLEVRDLDDKERQGRPSKECDNITIDPAVRGNWTRYMNHSCRQAANFVNRFVGDKKLTLVVACRDIQFGEEITVHYGADYWKAALYGCACGEDQCKLWDAEKNKAKGGNKVTWAEEKGRLQIEQEEVAKEACNKQEKGYMDKGLKHQTKKTSAARPGQRGKWTAETRMRDSPVKKKKLKRSTSYT